MAIIIGDYLHGVDVSEYQPNWTPDPQDSFYIIKATGKHGNGLYLDPSLSTKRALVRATGKPVGYYHFMNPSQHSVSPEKQAQFFVGNVYPLPGEFLVVDWERVRITQNSDVWVFPDESDKDRFITEVRRLAPDVKIGLYCNKSMWDSSNKNCGDFLWVAAWRDDPGVTGWTFWQYSSTPIDQDISIFKDPVELKKFFESPDQRLYALTKQNNTLLIRIAQTSGGFGS